MTHPIITKKVEEFEQEFVTLGYVDEHIKEIRPFLTQALEEAYEEGRKDVLNYPIYVSGRDAAINLSAIRTEAQRETAKEIVEYLEAGKNQRHSLNDMIKFFRSKYFAEDEPNKS